jgi:hypothetical protein
MGLHVEMALDSHLTVYARNQKVMNTTLSTFSASPSRDTHTSFGASMTPMIARRACALLFSEKLT